MHAAAMLTRLQGSKESFPSLVQLLPGLCRRVRHAVLPPNGRPVLRHGPNVNGEHPTFCSDALIARVNELKRSHDCS